MLQTIDDSLPPGYTSLKRDLSAIAVPEGTTVLLAEGTLLRVTQQLGDSFTVMNEFMQLFRVAGDDADALGLPKPQASALGEGRNG